MSQKPSVIEIDCQQVRRELSNYLDGDLTPELRLQTESHLAGCSHCAAVHDGMRNVVQLLGDEKLLEVPEGFGKRLYKRLLSEAGELAVTSCGGSNHITEIMNGSRQNLIVETPNLAIKEMPFPISTRKAPQLGALASARLHWPEYVMEAALLGAFMVSACLFGALYESPHSPVRHAIASQLLRRLLMGLSMGLSAIGIIYSPWGKRSGAHINPSVTLTFLRLGKVKNWDAIFYIASQFAGAALGVVLVARFVGKELADPAVRYVVTVPGEHGVWVALLAEFIIAFGMMSAILYFSNHHRLDRYTGLFAGLLVATYITLEAPFSGMSMNPARTFGSGLSADVWSGLWVYLTAPPLAMLTAAEVYLWRKGRLAVKCCKLHHDNDKRCIFCGANGGFAS